MGKVVKRAWLRCELKIDLDTDEYSVEVHEWAAGRSVDLTAFLDIGPKGASREEVQALADYVGEGARHLVTEYVELDKGRMF